MTLIDEMEAAANNASGQLTFLLSNWTRIIDELRAKDEEIEKLKRDVNFIANAQVTLLDKGKDWTIEDMAREIKEKDARILDLTEKCLDRGEQLVGLECDLEDKTDELRAKDAEIAKLRDWQKRAMGPMKEAIECVGVCKLRPGYLCNCYTCMMEKLFDEASK